MTPKQLQLVSKVQRVLDEIPHPDSYRIAREISSYYEYNPTNVDSAIQRILNNEPWEYIRGTAEFMGRMFKVTTDTLIPRIETGELVQHIVDYIKKNSEVKRIIDVGTGSGAIICSLALKLGKNYEYVATDSSQPAIEVATINTKSLGVKDTIQIINTNLIENILTDSNTIVIANLPYIPHSDYNLLEPSVKEYEHQNALDGGEDGLIYIKELIKQISKLQQKPSAIFLEIDPSQSKYLISLLQTVGDVEYSVEVIKDFMNNSRFVSATRTI